ncbi:MAG TPA: AAA family ATPase [Candidatus Paceibacterota bacterium]|nr:AAA family ATPase [Candidatus Paceibacterota bacterium]
MIKDQLKLASLSARPVVFLDIFLGQKVRYWLAKVFGGAAFILLCATIAINTTSAAFSTIFVGPLGVFLSFIGRLPGVDLARSGVVNISLFPGYDAVQLHLSSSLGQWNGVLLLSLSLYMVIKMLNAFARSSYYSGFVSAERGGVAQRSYDVQAIFARSPLGDLVYGVFSSALGREVLLRSGISLELFASYRDTRSVIVDYREDSAVLSIFSFSALVRYVVNDKSLHAWFDAQTIAIEDVIAAAEWVEASDAFFRLKERSWGKAALSRIPALAGDLAYGQGFKLKQYASEIIGPPAELGQAYGGPDVLRLEQSLSRDKGANALLIAPAPHVAEEVVRQFTRDIVYHFKHPFIAKKHCFLFDVQYFCKDMDDAGEFERELGDILADAANAGNVIFVISDLPALYIRARQLGADVAGTIRPYLSNNILQIIAISDTAQYHEVLAPQALLSEYLHDIHITEPENDVQLLALESIANRIESTHNLFFTVPALREVIRDAERTLVHGLLVDRAEEILEGIPAYLAQNKVVYVLPVHIDEYVSQASKIPIGKADKKEQERLMNIESLLHASVIGQDVAIRSIGDALRRSRSGVRNEKRPVASFFFFGPTGVGKTEVAKTLARVFFGGEEKMLRFDMSEFADGSALARLIGTIGGGQGALAPVMREHPYGVLLLDEFEKADSAVHDLFLQVLDEGIFHDAQGQIVNCRNAIIIATSNAGATQIFERTKQGAKFDNAFSHEVLQGIISEGALRPELLNRFDASVLFTPIEETGYRKIATLMLEKLASRLRGQGIVLVINDALIDVIMEKGVDPVFGARPMQRAIQDIVEKRVAEKILQGKTGPGVPLEFTKVELTT